MQTAAGDVILYSGRHPLHRRQHELTGCRWAQVGLVMTLPSCPTLLVFESTMLSPCVDVITGSVQQGVQLTKWADRVATFDGAIALRTWQPALSAAILDRLRAFVAEVHGRPFDSSPWTSFRAIRRANRTSRIDRFFCSHLVAAALQRAGLSEGPPAARLASNYIPADFSSGYRAALLPLDSSHQLLIERDIRSAYSTRSEPLLERRRSSSE